MNNINKLILGTVQFGLNYGINNTTGIPSYEQVSEILDHAAINNINKLDTAVAYGNAQGIIGKYTQTSGNLFQINSKFTYAANNTISEQLNNSLAKLNQVKLNTYFFHRYNDFVKHPECIAELLKLKDAGKINTIGVSVYENDELDIALNAKEIDVIQLPFNCFDNMNQRGSLLKKAKDNGKIIQVRSVYLQGLFFKDTDNIPTQLQPLKKHLISLKNLAAELKLTIYELALAYVIKQQFIDEIIIGVENKIQLSQNIEFFTKEFDPEVVHGINKINIKEVELLYPKNWN